MCFPSKRMKNNLADPEKPTGTKGSAASSAPSTTAPTPAPTTTTTPATTSTKMAPKVAIVIYSMYGHIAKCACCVIIYFRCAC